MAIPRDTNEAPSPGRYPTEVPGRRFRLIVEHLVRRTCRRGTLCPSPR
jgi:hypothetical protein